MTGYFVRGELLLFFNDLVNLKFSYAMTLLILYFEGVQMIEYLDYFIYGLEIIITRSDFFANKYKSCW